MARAIHIEIDAICLLVMCFIVWQSIRNINQQMRKIRFRNTVYGIIIALGLDIIWMLVDGVRFPGDIFINKLVNVLFLSAGVFIGGLWYLYVLDALGYRVPEKITWLIMAPGVIFLVLNLVTMKTGWIFYVTEDNVYVRGPLFWLQEIGAIGMLMISFFHILFAMFRKNRRGSRNEKKELLLFYAIPVVGTLASMPYTGMPGTWTCASVSVILIYLSAMDREILRDSLTGLNNRKALDNTFAEYARSSTEKNPLMLFMMDLDGFKGINDEYGHPSGDQALMVTGKLLLKSIEGIRSIAARYGGDEFLIMGFPQDAESFMERVKSKFAEYNTESELPFQLNISIGCAAYQAGQSLDSLISSADRKLYEEKRRKNVGRIF